VGERADEWWTTSRRKKGCEVVLPGKGVAVGEKEDRREGIRPREREIGRAGEWKRGSWEGRPRVGK